MKSALTLIERIVRFYADGFRNMSSWGRKVWVLIIIKLTVIFIVLKLFFFPDFLKMKFDNDADRGKYVLEKITNTDK